MYMSGANIDANQQDEDWEALYIAADIIGGGSLDSRLAGYVREQNGLSYQVGSSFNAGDFDRAGNYMTYATTNPANRDALVSAIETVHKKVISEGFTEDEVASAKTTYLEQVESMLSDDFSIGSTVHRYNDPWQKHESFAGTPGQGEASDCGRSECCREEIAVTTDGNHYRG